MDKCSCYDNEQGRCNGTRERDLCSCGGDETLCDFYPEKKAKARKKYKTKEPRTDGIDIHKIIDEAMEKKDRTVSIFIGEAGMSVNVSPRTDEEPRWIPVTYIDSDRIRGYQCSACGYEDEYDHHPYCAMCGEKLRRAD